MKTKIAIIGIGGGVAGWGHYDVYKNIDDIDIVSACDINLEAANERITGTDDKHIYAIRLYSDYDKFLKGENPEEIDYVDICTPTYLHKEFTIKALESGFNVLCEKPMGLSKAETDEILEVAKRTGKFYMVAQVVRFHEVFRYLKDAVDSKKHGKLLRLDMKRISSIPQKEWFHDEERSGLVGLDMMLHDVDFVQYCFGMPKDIMGVNYDIKNRNNYLAVTYLYDGFTVSVETGWYNTKMPFRQEFIAVFENGYMIFRDGVLNDNGEDVVFEHDNKTQDHDIGIPINTDNPYAIQFQYFANCIKSGKKPEVASPESTAASVTLIEMTKEKALKI